MVVSPWPHFLAHRVGTDGLIVAKRYASQTAIGGGISSRRPRGNSLFYGCATVSCVGVARGWARCIKN